MLCCADKIRVGRLVELFTGSERMGIMSISEQVNIFRIHHWKSTDLLSERHLVVAAWSGARIGSQFDRVCGDVLRRATFGGDT